MRVNHSNLKRNDPWLATSVPRYLPRSLQLKEEWKESIQKASQLHTPYNTSARHSQTSPFTMGSVKNKLEGYSIQKLRKQALLCSSVITWSKGAKARPPTSTGPGKRQESTWTAMPKIYALRRKNRKALKTKSKISADEVILGHVLI